MIDCTDLVNRLTKNARHWAKWARRQGISCYRVFDRDLPAFPLVIDIYEGGRAHLQEVDTGWQQTPEEHAAWVKAVTEAVCSTLAIPPSHLFCKIRQRQKGDAQYEKIAATGQEFIVTENGRRFWVNLADYLDIGLFLDHRNTRKKIGELAHGKRLLNLFAYTGSFSVYAATGGAISSETVDLSNTYQTWTIRNFNLNNVDSRFHTLIRDDVFHYLDEAGAQHKQFDLIVLDPPTFSNSKKMIGVLDVQRDHPLLIAQSMRLLAPGGTLFFSNNLRSFELDPGLTQALDIIETSHQSVPEDFRNRKIHRCFEIRHKA